MAVIKDKYKKEIDGGTITVKIKFVTNISWFDALKLRLAGREAVKEFIETRFNETREKCQNCVEEDNNETIC